MLMTALLATIPFLHSNLEIINNTELFERFYLVDDSETLNDLVCLSLNVYHEARGSTELDQFAVAHVTLNRSSAASKSICEVVYQPYQFSWTTDNLPDFPYEQRAWYKSQEIAWFAYSKQRRDPTSGANHYHRYDMNPPPRWSKPTEAMTIGAHLYMEL